MRSRRYLLLALLPLALSACGESKPELPDEVKPSPAAKAVVKAIVANSAIPGEGSGPDKKRLEVTPMADRVATIGLLNKRNNLTRDLTLKPGESRRVDNVIVKLSSCERTAPWENPPETGAFVQVFVEQRATVREQLRWYKVFSGWLFRNQPALSIVEHPVYDVWVKDCAMKFPGEEAKPAAAAPSSSAAKPAGRPSPAASATPTPAPTAAPSPAAPPPPPAPSA